MELLRNTALILLWILGVTYAQDIYVAAPSSLRLNIYENIAIAIDGTRSERVNILVQDYPEKKRNIYLSNVPVRPGVPIISKIKLDAVEFPPGFLEAPGSPKLVALSAGIQGNVREMLVPISSQSGYMFIQTDRPIYSPKERALFRIIPLTEDGLLSKERFQLQIKDHEGIIVDEKFFNEKRSRLLNHFATHSYKFSEYSRNGEWSAVVRFGKNLEQNTSVSFELQEYVLPTFAVTLKTPDVILATHEEIVIDVEAKYVYGISINGIVSFRFGVQAPRMPNAIFFSLTHPKALVDGSLRFTLSTNDFKTHRDIGWFPRIEGSTFVVEATVVDVATGDRILEINSRCRFLKSPFLISFKRCLSDFKPGLTSVFEADINYINGKPAEGISTRLTAVADNRLPLNIFQSTSTSNGNGIVSFELRPEIHHKILTLTLETTQEGYAGSQAKGTYVQRAYSSANISYIAISRSTPFRLLPGDVFRRDIYLEPEGIQNIYYLVVSRGKIQTIGKLSRGQYKVQRFEFPITHEMVPNFRVVVFAHHGNDLVADSLRIDVEKICSHNAKITLEPVFNLKTPGSDGKIILRGKNGTLVGLLAVDEAVYALSKKHLLTKEKVFDHLASHDLGCGTGGGLNINAVLGNAGIMIATNKFTPSHSYSCDEVKRKKRSVGSNSDAFEEEVDGFDYTDLELPYEFERQFPVRTDFRETWIFLDTMLGLDGKEELAISLPHSTTTWVIQAVSLSPSHGICVAEPKKLVSFTEIFLHLSLPYSVKLYEQVNVQATVFNYGVRKARVIVNMYGVEGICSDAEPGAKGEAKGLFIDGNSAKTVIFPIIPLKLEDFPIKVTAFSIEGHDVIEKILHVVPEGIREEINVVVKLDPANLQNRKDRTIWTGYFTDMIESSRNLQVTAFSVSLPNETVPGTATFSISVKGDMARTAVETSFKNPEDFILLPSGDGETNVMFLSHTVYTVQYLKKTGKLTPPTRERSYGLISSGIDNQLNYKSDDGSYSTWVLRPTSTWLTAFVMKVFCHVIDMIPVDKDVISSGMGWFVKNQESDGSYVEKNIILHKEMMGGVDGTISMTAFVLIALEECSNKEPVADDDLKLARLRAVDFLQSSLNEIQTPLQAAIVAYALARSNGSHKVLANQRLLSMANYDQENKFLYWTTRDSSHDIETAGYGLLTQLLLNDAYRSTSIVNWLNTKQLQAGDIKSTQDTVIALQSLSEYATKEDMFALNLVSSLSVTQGRKFTEILRLNKDNAMGLSYKTTRYPEGMLLIKTEGTGLGTLSLKLEYNVMKPELEICEFFINATASEAKNDENSYEDLDEKHFTLHINVCMRYLGKESAGMTVADIEIFSGFVPDEKDLEKLERDPYSLIEKFENLNRRVLFYLKMVPTKHDYCFSFQVYRKYIIGKAQSSMVKVYEYYNPEAVCTKFYNPTEKTVSLSTICDGGVCECATGSCPPKSPFANLLEVQSTATRRDELNNMLCFNFDYVWKGKLKGRVRKFGQFLNMSFEILEVISSGIEKKENLEKEVRTLRAREHCEAAQMHPGVTYLVMGKDPPARAEGDIRYYKYLLDKSSIIHICEPRHLARSTILKRDLNYVTQELRNKGCSD